MTVKKMLEFINAVLALHPSRSKSSQKLFPRVALKRLSHETIKKYTEIHNRFESSCDKPNSSCESPSRREVSVLDKPSTLHEYERKDEKLPDTPSESENSDSSSSDDATNYVLDNSSIMRQDDSSEQRRDSEDGLQESPDLDTLSSCSSDELPDLNDPTWNRNVKKAEVKKRKKKKKDTQKTDAKLMKYARKVFQHQASRYKSSKEFMKSTKTFKEIQNGELKSHSSDISNSPNVLPKICAQSSSHMELTSLSNWTAQTVDTPSHRESIMEGPARSQAEIMTMKLKESMARYVGQERQSSVPGDNTNLKMHPLNTTNSKSRAQFSEQHSSQYEESEDSHDSDDSCCTVLFDDNEIKEIYPIESAHTVTGESNIGGRDFTTFADESSNSKKRKDSPLKKGESVETIKKLRWEDGQDMVSEVITDQQPMVLIPISISSPISLSPAVATGVPSSHLVSPVPHTQKPLKSPCRSVDCSNVSSQANDTTHLGKRGNCETNVREKEVSEVHCSLSSTTGVEVGDSSVNTVDIEKEVSHPFHAPQNECILFNISTSQKRDEKTDENFHATTQVSRANSEEQITCISNHGTIDPIDNQIIRKEKKANNMRESVTDSNNDKLESQQRKASSSLNEAGVGSSEKSLKSLKRIQELTRKRDHCEEKIRQMKEEFNKKLEALEEEKKNFNIEINKMIAAMSEWKELSNEEQFVPDEQQGPAASTSGAAVREAGPETVTSTAKTSVLQSTPVTMAAASINANRSTERKSINIIPAASIKNFGRKKTPSTPEQAAISAPPQPKLSLIQTAVSSPHLQEKQTLRIVSQVPVTSGSSASGSKDCPPNNHQLRPNMVQFSALDKQAPPNAVVIPGQQHPVVTSSHILCHAPPLPTTHAAQRRAPVCQVVKTVQSSNPGSLLGGFKNPVSSQAQQMQTLPLQVQQNCQYMPLQLQQHQQQHQQKQQQPQLLRLLPEQQLPQQQQQQEQKQQQYQQHEQQQQAQLQPASNAHLAQQQPSNSQSYLQQYQPVEDQLQDNTTALQGRVVPGTYTSPVGSNSVNCSSVQMVSNLPLGVIIPNDKNTTTPTNRIIITQSQQGNSIIPNPDTSIQKAGYIVRSINPTHFQHQTQSANLVTGNKVISISLPSVSNGTATATTVNTNNMNIPAPANTQASTAYRGINDSTAGSLPAPAPYTDGSFPQESETNEPICVMCGSTGIFTCCNNVIYCSTTCQGNDWSTHQHKCTNTSMPDTS